MTDRREDLLARVRAHLGLTTVGPYAQLVEDRVARLKDARRLEDIVEAVVIPETYFFREPGRLRFLVRTVVASLLPERPEGHVLRVWSAGCSTGEEPFTLAMLLDEAGRVPARILGTDVSNAALEHAAAGVYRDWSFRGVPTDVRQRYFTAEGGSFRVSSAIREQVAFQRHNLLRDLYPDRQDVIVCRNVLVYLDPDTQRTVGRRLAAALAPGGWLMTSATDPMLDADLDLEHRRTPAGLLYHRPAGQQVPPAPSRTASAPPAPRMARFELAGPVEPPPVPGAEHIRALISRRRLGDAAQRTSAAIEAAPLDPELRYLQAVIALEGGAVDDAVAAATAACYLAPGLAAVHVVLGHAQQAAGEGSKALRSWERARDLLLTVDEDQPVPLADDEPAGRLLALLEALTVRTAVEAR